MVTEVDTLFSCTQILYSVHVSLYLDNLVHSLRELPDAFQLWWIGSYAAFSLQTLCDRAC